MATNEVLVGKSVKKTGQVVARGSDFGEMAVVDGHARYMDAVLNGNVYTAANTASQALSLGSATATGLVLTNPAGSGKNLVILEIASYISAAITAVANVAVFVNFLPHCIH